MINGTMICGSDDFAVTPTLLELNARYRSDTFSVISVPKTFG